MHDESHLFFDSDKGGPNINKAFIGLTEDSRVGYASFMCYCIV